MRNTKAFTLTELIIVVVVIVVLALILMPAFPTHNEDARAMSCISNMKQIGLALAEYEQAYDNRVPPRQTVASNGHVQSWRSEIYPYIKFASVFQCISNSAGQWPDIESEGFHRSYAVNSSTGGRNDVGGPFSDRNAGLRLDRITDPSNAIAVVESTSALNDFNPLFPAAFAQPTREHWRTGHLFCGHRDRTNVLFTDGHVRSMRPVVTTNMRAYNAPPTSPGINGWTIDGSPFSPADQATATSTIQYGVAMGHDK